jgi:DNA-binding GntR family transcriptional regulator
MEWELQVPGALRRKNQAFAGAGAVCMGGDGHNEGWQTAHDRDKTGQVYARLRTSFLLQKLPPRTPLNMQAIAKQLQVSVTPVREALIRLAHEGIVASVQKKGFQTKPLSLADLRADYDMAFMIAAYTIGKNVSGFSMIGLCRPSESADRGFPGRYAVFLESLYERIAGLSGNNKFVALMQAFNDRTSLIRQIDLEHPERRASTMREVDEFIGFLVSHDASNAIRSLDEQFRATDERLRDLVKEATALSLEAEWAL